MHKEENQLLPVQGHDDFLQRFVNPGDPTLESFRRVESFARSLLAQAKAAKKQYHIVRTKFFIEEITIDCRESIKDALGFTNNKTFQDIIDELIESGRIRRVGLDYVSAQEKKKVYDLTKTYPRSRVFFINIKNTSFPKIRYECHVDQDLTEFVKSKKTTFIELKKQAKEIEKRNTEIASNRELLQKSRWIKAAISLQKFLDVPKTKIAIHEHLSIEKNIFPIYEKIFEKHFRHLLSKDVLLESTDEHENITYRINPKWGMEKT